MQACSPELADQSTSTLPELDATFNQRVKELETQNEELQERNNELETQKSRYANKVKDLRDKRDQLWGEIDDLKDALKAKNEKLQAAVDSRADHRRAEAALREELGSLRRFLRDQQGSVAQATAQANEKTEQASLKQTLLEENVEQLEKRLQEQSKRIQDQQASLALATIQANEKTRDANTKQVLLKETVAQLERRLLEQSRALEDERAQLLRQANTRQKDAQAELSSSLDEAMPQLRSLLIAYDRVRVNEKRQPAKASRKQTSTALTIFGQAAESDLEKRLKEQADAFDQERAQLLDQASDAAKTQQDITRQHLMEREGFLTCLISLDLFEFPVVTSCCGKTFSSEGLRQSITRSPLCPFCRERLASTHPNRDMTKLVELHRRERSVLGISGAEAPIPTLPAPHSDEYAVISNAATGRTHSRRSTTSSSTRQSRHRENRSERTQARSEVTRHRSSRHNTRASSSSDVMPSAAPIPAENAAVTAPTTTVQAQSSGRTVYRIGSGMPPTAVPPHMVRSELASMHFPSPQTRSKTRGRRQCSTARAVAASTSTAASTAGGRPSASRRRTARSSAAPVIASSALSSAAPTAMPSSRILLRPIPGASSVSVQSNAASVRLASMSNGPVSAAPTSLSSATSASRSGQVSRASVAASLGAYMDDWLRTQPASAATAVRSQGELSRRSAAPTSASTSAMSSVATTAPNAPRARFAASQDDTALVRQRHDSPRLTASQPVPRQPLSSIAQGITSLRDLLGSDFESTSDSG